MDNLIELKSVGCLLDVEKGIAYPQFKDGEPDFSLPLHLREEEMSSDWYEQLSLEDGLHVTKSLSLVDKYDGNKGWIMSNDYLDVLKNQINKNG